MVRSFFFPYNTVSTSQFAEQALVYSRLFEPVFKKPLADHEKINNSIVQLRVKKDAVELAAMRKAVDLSCDAQTALMRGIYAGMKESQARAIGVKVMYENNGLPAYGAIVGAGLNSTILHYHAPADAVLHDGDVLLVDMGATVDGYRGDLTRTMPISGTWTARQREVYNIVLETQKYAEQHADLSICMGATKQDAKGNRFYNRGESSLNFLIRAFLKARGCEQYFPHGLGHDLGLDMHDIGDRDANFQAGRVFTIEPGIYIPEEKLGIRIEDNYAFDSDGRLIRLSERLVREADDVERVMAEGKRERLKLAAALREERA